MPLNFLFTPQKNLDMALDLHRQDQSIHRTYFNETKTLIECSPYPIMTSLLLILMANNGLIDHNNLKQVKNNLTHVREIYRILQLIEKMNLLHPELSQIHFNSIINYPGKSKLSKVLESLKYLAENISLPIDQIIDQEQLNLLLNPANEYKISEIISITKDNRFYPLFNISSSKNILKIILEHTKPLEVAEGLLLLKQNNLSQFNIDMIKHSSPIQLSYAFIKLQKNKMLFRIASNKIRNFITQTIYPSAIADAMIKFNRVGILDTEVYFQSLSILPGLSDEQISVKSRLMIQLYQSCPLIFSKTHSSYIKKILNHADPENVIMGLYLLYTKKLLNGPYGIYNLDLVLSRKYPLHIANLITELQNHNLLSGPVAEKHRKLILNQPQEINLCRLARLFIFEKAYIGNAKQILIMKTENFRFLARHANLASFYYFIKPFQVDSYHDLLRLIKNYPALLNNDLIKHVEWEQLLFQCLDANSVAIIKGLCEQYQGKTNIPALLFHVRAHVRLASMDSLQHQNSQKKPILSNQERLDALQPTPELSDAGYVAPMPKPEWICPISRDLINEAVSSGSKYTGYYEKYYLLQWLEKNSTDPCTREGVTFHGMQVLPEVSRQIDKFLSAHEVYKNFVKDNMRSQPTLNYR